jgi:CRP/FNR family transcriptional regulator, cyclic AMP receptor protein
MSTLPPSRDSKAARPAAKSKADPILVRTRALPHRDTSHNRIKAAAHDESSAGKTKAAPARNTSPGPLFDLKSFLATPGEGRVLCNYRKNELIFSQGEAADAVFYIERGKIKITVISEQGKEAVSGILGPDEFFGESCIAGQTHRLSRVVATTDAVITRFDKASFVRALHQESTLADMFIQRTLARSIRVEADLVDQLFNSSEKRLARLLLLMADFGNKAGDHVVIAKVSQETLAEMIGTTRSRVSFFMNKFRRLGLIDYRDRIEVRRSLLDFILREQPEIKI